LGVTAFTEKAQWELRRVCRRFGDKTLFWTTNIWATAALGSATQIVCCPNVWQSLEELAPTVILVIIVKWIQSCCYHVREVFQAEKKQKNAFSDRPLSWTALGSLQHSPDPNVCGGCFPAGNGHRKGRGKWDGRDLHLEKNEKLTTMQEKQTLALYTISFICILVHL